MIDTGQILLKRALFRAQFAYIKCQLFLDSLFVLKLGLQRRVCVLQHC